MAPVKNQSFVEQLVGRSDIALAVGVIGIIGVLVIPIPTMLLDFALAFNIAFSLVVLLTTLALLIARPLGLEVQQRLTTDPRALQHLVPEVAAGAARGVPIYRVALCDRGA